jgi:hypothetical protein
MRLPDPNRALALAACSIALATAALAAPAAAPKNLLANPGFEKRLPGADWMPAGWDTSDAGLETVFFGRDSFDVHGGKYSVNVANTSTLYAMGHNWNQSLLVGPETWGKTAVLSVWTKSNGQQGRAYLLLQAYRDTISKMSVIWGVDRDEAQRRLGISKVNDPLRDVGWQRTVFEEQTTGWVRREARIVIGRGANIVFVRCGLIGTGQVLFDDASLTLEPGPAAVAPVPKGRNVLVDPSFENGATAWEWSIPPFEGARIDRDTTVAHSGRTSMLLSHFNNGVVSSRMGMCQTFSAAGLRGQRVRIGGWMRGDSLTGPAYVMVAAHTPELVARSGTTGQYTGTFDWTYTETEFDVPKDAEVIWAWMVVNAPAYGRLWFDDASLEVIGPSSAATPAAAPKPRKSVSKKP